MKVESLQELRAAFASWRREKQHARERTPLLLIVQAREAAKKYGHRAVVRATGIDSQLLGEVAECSGRTAASNKMVKPEAPSRVVPAFSRIALNAPALPNTRPLVEVETAAGVKLRFFEQTPEVLDLLAAACGLGGSQ